MLEIVYGKRCENRKLFENQGIVCNCRSCFMTRAIRKSFEDPEKHEAWKERTKRRAQAMRAMVKHPHGAKGSTHPNWKGGLPNCTGCGKRLCERGYTQCRSCVRKKPPRLCMDCKVPIRRRAKRCKQCFVKWRRGKNHHHWKGGKLSPAAKLRNTQKTRDWAKAVKHRDNFTCRLCRIRGGTLHTHHIERWADRPDLRFDIENGVTLCRDCHLQIVHQGSWSNKPLNFWSS